MLKLREEQFSLWDAVLPEPLRSLPDELAKVDALLDDPRFMQPFINKFQTRRGRPTLPVETYLRLMYLKRRYNLGYETLVQEVGDSITWRRFCHFAIDAKMPDSSTLIKARQRYGDDVAEELNNLLLEKLHEEKILKTRKLRVDTTVVESDIHHPTDATLLQDGVKVITRVVQKIRKVASHAAQGFMDRTSEVKEQIFSIAKLLRRRTQQSWDEINMITQKVIDVTEEVCTQATIVIERVKDRQRTAVKTMKEKLDHAVTLTQKLIGQAKQVVAGNRTIPDRIISFFDPEARPIKKGKLGRTAEFGYKLRMDETESGFITGHQLYMGNPADDELLIPAVQQHIDRFHAAPHAVATDRGFSNRENEDLLQNMGVNRVSIPKRGKKSKKRAEHEASLWFKELQRFRSGCEAKISLVKRKYGLNKSRYRGFVGSKTWVSHGIWVHNLKRAAQMMK
jgi:transposase, IS5 family